MLPDVSGLRVLDVGTFDGFWAFTMERAGAAEVMATDLPSIEAAVPTTAAPALLAEIGDLELGRRFAEPPSCWTRACAAKYAIHDLDPDRLGGPFDFVVVSDLLIHLRDPVGGLEAVRGVLKPGGRLLVTEQTNLWLTIAHRRMPVAKFDAKATHFNWWEGNPACLAAWLELAGFESPHRRRRYRLTTRTNRGLGRGLWHLALEARRE